MQHTLLMWKVSMWLHLFAVSERAVTQQQQH